MSKKQIQQKRARKWKRPPGTSMARFDVKPECSKCLKKYGSLAKPLPIHSGGLCRFHAYDQEVPTA